MVVALIACGGGESGAESGGGAGGGASPAPSVPAPAPPAPTFAGELAVTLDDLPWVGALPPGVSRGEATGRLLSALSGAGAPATGFVDCGRVQPGAPVLRQWLKRGMRLGNHTANHVDLDRAGAERWIAAARSCDADLRKLTGDSAIYFRYPYLHRGKTPELYAAARRALDELGAIVAPVTIVTVDWILAAPYTNALAARDSARADSIGATLVDHVLRTTRHYQAVAREKVGRDVAHILLLHANALPADNVGRVLEHLRAEGFRFVPLDSVLRDPIYRLPDAYIGPEGLSWLYRMKPATPEMSAWDDAEAARLRRMFPR